MEAEKFSGWSPDKEAFVAFWSDQVNSIFGIAPKNFELKKWVFIKKQDNNLALLLKDQIRNEQRCFISITEGVLSAGWLYGHVGEGHYL